MLSQTTTAYRLTFVESLCGYSTSHKKKYIKKKVLMIREYIKIRLPGKHQ